MTEDDDCCGWPAGAPGALPAWWAGVDEPLEPFCTTGERLSAPGATVLDGGGKAGFRGLCLAGPG